MWWTTLSHKFKSSTLHLHVDHQRRRVHQLKSYMFPFKIAVVSVCVFPGWMSIRSTCHLFWHLTHPMREAVKSHTDWRWWKVVPRRLRKLKSDLWSKEKGQRTLERACCSETDGCRQQEETARLRMRAGRKLVGRGWVVDRNWIHSEGREKKRSKKPTDETR